MKMDQLAIETKNPVKKKTTVAFIILIAILGVFVYANSLNIKFIWDDDLLIKDNKYIKSWSCISKIFTENIEAGAGKKCSFYRPLQMLTYMVDYSFWKLNVIGYHLTNIILHILVALCIYWLIYILYKDRLLSFLTSIFFLVHPIHTEAVSYISGRADPLAVLFMLLCLILYIKGLTLNNTRLHILILLSYTLALLTRENSLILPILLLLYHHTFKKRLKIKEFLPILGITFIYIILRVVALRELLSNVSSSTALSQRLPGFFAAITNYLRLLILPFNLHMEYGKQLFYLTDPKTMLGIAIVFISIAYALRQRVHNRVIVFSILWFFIALLPVSNIYPVNAYMAEHWLYLPSIGFFLILAQGVCILYRRKGSRIFAAAFAISLLAFYSHLTIKQNNYWKEPIAFYERTLKYAPDSPTVLLNLGNAYNDIGKNEEAIALFKKTIELNPNYEEAYYNLGIAYKDIGRKEEAIASYKKAVELNPNYAEAFNNLGIVYKDIGRNENAMVSFKKAIELNPGYEKAYYNLGIIYNDMGGKEEAIALYKKAIALDPTYVEAYNNLGVAYRDIGRKEEAIALLKKAIALNPHFEGAYYNLGIAYSGIGKNEEVIALYKKAIELNPSYIDAYNNLGIIYNDMGEKEEAIALYKKAIELNPTYEKAYYNLGIAYKDVGEYEEAISLFKKAIELNSGYVDAYNNLGAAYATIGRKEEAISSFKKAIEIDKNCATAYKNLAVAYYYEKQYELAIKYYDRAIELGFKVDPEFLKLLEPFR